MRTPSSSTPLRSDPLGCDTFVAFPPFCPPGTVVFGKNSDRPSGEGQNIKRYDSKDYDDGAECSCTYISIPQVSHTHAVLLSQIDWMFGAEMGANEFGVVIGNEAVWTREPNEKARSALIGMDLVRLGLERGGSARQAKEVITSLLERHGQCGPCAQDDESFTYDNSYLIADSKEAFVLETAGRYWVTEHITTGIRNISNGLTIRKKYDECRVGLLEHAKERGLWDGEDEKLDWAACFSLGPAEDSDDSRQVCGTRLLQQHSDGSLTPQAMMEILKDHESGICMHGGGFETTASMVSELHSDGESARHWMTGKPYPCQSEFVEQTVNQK